jgi:ketosteroid isomerase-like protein
MKKLLIAALTILSLVIAQGSGMADYANDRAEIENMSNKYMIAMDAGDIETVMSLWAEDGEMYWVFGEEHGKEAIRRALVPFATGLADKEKIEEGATWRPRARHQIINHVIDVDGDTAHTIAYWFALTNKTPQGDVQVFYFGHYEAEMVRRNGRWLFKKRVIYNESRQNRKLFYPGLGETDPRKH